MIIISFFYFNNSFGVVGSSHAKKTHPTEEVAARKEPIPAIKLAKNNIYYQPF